LVDEKPSSGWRERKMALLTQSYVHGVSSTPLIGETIGQLLRRVTAEGPERPALVTRHQSVRLSYADLLRFWRSLAPRSRGSFSSTSIPPIEATNSTTRSRNPAAGR
jgi:hypothetical protein